MTTTLMDFTVVVQSTYQMLAYAARYALSYQFNTLADKRLPWTTHWKLDTDNSWMLCDSKLLINSSSTDSTIWLGRYLMQTNTNHNDDVLVYLVMRLE